MIDLGAKLVALPVQVWQDCGQPENVLQANRYLLSKSPLQAGRAKDSIVIPPVFIANTAVVEHSIVGPYVTIGEHAQVTSSILRDSIVNEGAHIENATLAESLIGSYAMVRGSHKRLNVGDSSEVSLL
jgi:glucose-1-phosphate thymidylyltransferase